MGSGHGFLGIFLLIVPMLILSCSSPSQATAYKFNVGGKDGWVVKPSEGYSHWAQRNRFQVNDTLYFKYKKGSDSVVVVNKQDYDSCNPKNPINKMDDGDSTFKFDRSGPFFFITGNVENCQHGQKLIVVVLAVRHKQTPSPTSPPPVAPPSPAQSPAEAKSPEGSAPSPSPSVGPSVEDSPAPSPSGHSGSTRFSGSVGVALGVSIGVALFFSSFA